MTKIQEIPGDLDNLVYSEKNINYDELLNLFDFSKRSGTVTSKSSKELTENDKKYAKVLGKSEESFKTFKDSLVQYPDEDGKISRFVSGARPEHWDREIARALDELTILDIREVLDEAIKDYSITKKVPLYECMLKKNDFLENFSKFIIEKEKEKVTPREIPEEVLKWMKKNADYLPWADIIAKADEDIRRRQAQYEAQQEAEKAKAEVEKQEISGYRDLSKSERSAIEDFRESERVLLKMVDELYTSTDPICDGRWLSIATTHFEQGFMAIVRAIAKPER